jgi:hypothetical protein
MDFAQSAVDRPSGDRRRWSGSTYPGTLMRPDAQAHLRLAVDELGFRYVRFHAIFHDILGTVAASWGHLWGHIFWTTRATPILCEVRVPSRHQ